MLVLAAVRPRQREAEMLRCPRRRADPGLRCGSAAPTRPRGASCRRAGLHCVRRRWSEPEAHHRAHGCRGRRSRGECLGRRRRGEEVQRCARRPAQGTPRLCYGRACAWERTWEHWDGRSAAARAYPAPCDLVSCCERPVEITSDAHGPACCCCAAIWYEVRRRAWQQGGVLLYAQLRRPCHARGGSAWRRGRDDEDGAQRGAAAFAVVERASTRSADDDPLRALGQVDAAAGVSR